MTALWLSETVSRFWSLAGEEESFPRSLERSVALALPLAIVKLPRLRLRGVEEWLRRRGISCQLAVGDRLLRGCLAAYRGTGLVFIDGADSADEVRFTLAHEVAHFLVDYQMVRERAAQRLGPAIFEVLDGLRPPTREERVHAILSSAALGLHLHLMERSAHGCTEDGIDEAERRADRLALELLAPAEEVRRRLIERRRPASIEAAVEVLSLEMGLPAAVAREYAPVVVPEGRTPPSFIRQLGFRE